MKKCGYFILWITLCFFVETSYAELIKYTDKDGTLCFADDLGKVPKRYRQNIIRDEEEGAVQIINSEDQSRQTNSAGNSENEIVQICYGLSNFISLYKGHILTCFLNARDYPYHLYDVKNRDNIIPCAEFWCKLHLKNDSPNCIKETSEKIHFITPFTVIGNRLFPTTKSHILKEIDMHFNVNPKTRVKWHGANGSSH